MPVKWMKIFNYAGLRYHRKIQLSLNSILTLFHCLLSWAFILKYSNWWNINWWTSVMVFSFRNVNSMITGMRWGGVRPYACIICLLYFEQEFYLTFIIQSESCLSTFPLFLLKYSGRYIHMSSIGGFEFKYSPVITLSL